MRGFIGLGNMGSAIAEQFLKNGVELIVYDVDKEAVKRLVEKGAISSSSINEMVEKASVIWTCLPSPAISISVVKDVASALQKKPSHAGQLKLYVELSTIGRSSILQVGGILSAQGVQVVDAPVSGGPLGARLGTLGLMLSGQNDAAQHVIQCCKPFCSNITLIGSDPGQAQLGKIINNGISMTAFLASCEVVSVGVGAGIPADEIITYVNHSTGRNSGTETKLPKYILDRTFDGGATLVSALKDQALYLEEYYKAGLPTVGVIPAMHALWEKTATVLDPLGDATTIIWYFESFTGAEVVSGTGQKSLAGAEVAQRLKLLNSALAYTVLAATCEAVSVGLSSGIEPEMQVQLLNTGTARSYWSDSVFSPQVLTRSFNTETSIAEACSTLENYLELASTVGLPHCLISSALKVWQSVAEEIGEDKDVTEIIRRNESLIGEKFVANV